jgi:RND superfamily putative drug exporter
MFGAWGRLVHRRRWPVLAVSGALLLLSLAAIRAGGELKSNSPGSSSLQSVKAANLANAEIHPTGGSPGTSFDILFRSGSLEVADPAYRSALQDAIAPLESDPRVTSVATPYDPGRSAQVSRDGRQALVVVQLRDPESVAQHYYPALRRAVRPSGLTVTFTGPLPVQAAFNSTLESDLQRAEFVSLPVSLVLLLLIFGAVVAAALPLTVGVLGILGGLAATLVLARFTDVSQYALNIVTLIGLGVAIDYSLFIVNRYRDELGAGTPPEAAMGNTIATAGRAITFSGLTVAVGLSCMLFYQGTFLASMGAAGGMVVFVAVFYGLTFLPALLAVLGTRVDRLRVSSLVRRRARGGFWRTAASHVMARPLLFLLPALAVLLVLGAPFTHIRLANSGVDALPPHVEARQGYDRLIRDFPGENANFYSVVVHYPTAGVLTPARVGELYDLSRRIAAEPGVVGVQSAVDGDPSLSKADYVRMYSQPSGSLPPAIQTLVASTTGRDVAVLFVAGNQPASSDAARSLLKALRAQRLPGAEVLVSGQTALDVDEIGFIIGRTPIAIAFVLLVTYLVLFLLTGSLVLPLKALVVNLLSISASFGAMVWIFQDGHLSGLLDFTPQSVDPILPVILFSIVFGLSMDYEVLLVSRIHEEYVRTGDNRHAVAEGLERSGRLITGAAAIMVAVFLAFGLAEVVVIKSIGIGLAIAVAVDATLVRALLVPSVMRLLGDWNWWAPGPLRRLHARSGLNELGRAAAA